MIRRAVFSLVTGLLLGVPASASGAVLTTGVLSNELGAPTAGEVRVYAFDLPATAKGVGSCRIWVRGRPELTDSSWSTPSTTLS